MKIRKATLKDLDKIVKLYVELIKYRKRTFKYLGSTVDARNNITKKLIVKAIKSYLTHPKDSIVLVAEENRKIKGFASVTIHPKKRINKKKFAEIIDIYVHKKGEGIGEMLLKEIKKWAKRKKAKFVLWEVSPRNKLAMNFLKKNKFDNYRIQKIKELK